MVTLQVSAIKRVLKLIILMMVICLATAQNYPSDVNRTFGTLIIVNTIIIHVEDLGISARKFQNVTKILYVFQKSPIFLVCFAKDLVDSLHI